LYGLGFAAHDLLQKRKRVVALEAAKNWRLVVVGFNYFSLYGDLEVRGFAECDYIKIIPIF
jgi:hypothetical protein